MESATEYQIRTDLIEVFKTNVNDTLVAFEILCELKVLFPDFNINFDLEDCDRILRVDSCGKYIEVSRILSIVIRKGHTIEQLD